MKYSIRFAVAALAAGMLVWGATRADAACIDPNTNTVSNAADCLFATGGATDNCRVAVSIDMDGSGTPPVDPKKITCMDGAPCDQDGAANGVCTFRVGACVNLSVPGCAADTVTAGVVSKPGAKEANDAFKTPSGVYTRRALLDGLDALLPTSATGVCTDADIPVKVELKSKGGTCNSPAGDSCVSDLDCDDYCQPVFQKNKINVAFGVTDSAGTAAAKFKLNCVPADATTQGAKGAQAFQITDPGDLIGGPLAMGRTGDYMIRNGNIRAVVRAPGRQHSFTLLHGGQIIDADLVRNDGSADRDGWQGIAPLVNISSTQATQDVAVDNDGSDGAAAVIHSAGPDDLFDPIKPDILVLAAGLTVPANAVDKNLPVDLSTDLYLTPSSNTVQMALTVKNTTGSALGYYMGDYINPSGQLEPFGPGQGYGETQLRNGGTTGSKGQTLDYLAFQGAQDSAGVTYGVIFPGTQPATSTVKTGAFASSGVYAWVTNQDLFQSLFAPPASKPAGGFSVPANGQRTLRRWFVVGKTVADVTKARTELFQQEKAALQGTVTVGGQPVAGAHVTLLNDYVNYASQCSSGNCANVFSSTLTDENGFYRFVVPAGTYRLTARKQGAPYQGSSDTPTETPVVLTAKKTLVSDVALPATGTVVVNAVDQDGNPIAAKVSIVGKPASPNPTNDEYLGVGIPFSGRYFGYDYEEKGDIFGLVGARFTELDGSTGAFSLEPGTYNVVVSHGYEYDVSSEEITVTAGGTSTVNAEVHKVVDTSGFVSIDTHVHMINSPDSTISRERRILSMIAEGVDFFVNTDHDFLHSLSDDITGMGATGKVANAPSVETTTSHYGHFNTWPLTVDAGQVAGGAIDWSFHDGDIVGNGYPADGEFDLLPGEIFARGAAYAGTQVIQVNHFNSGTLGHFNMLGVNTALASPVSSNAVYRCVGGSYEGLPCKVKICVGGTNDGATCSADGDCAGGGTCPSQTNACSGGGTCTLTGNNLGSYLRLDPTVANLYDDGYTALEVWIEAGRGQTDLLRGDNMADWFNLLNHGHWKAGTADSDTHSLVSVQSGGPRTFVASSTDDPASISASELATNVNALRAVGSNAPFLKVELENGSAQQAGLALGKPSTVTYTGGGADKVKVHVESPTWAQFDTIDVYMNASPSCHSEWTFIGVINPSKCDTVVPAYTLHKGADFNVSTETGVSGSGQRLVADVELPVTISQDTWVVVVARGTDGVSKPLFPMEPQDLQESGNATLDDLTDNGSDLPWNLNEKGAMALAYSNPLFFDNGDGLCHGGSPCPGL